MKTLCIMRGDALFTVADYPKHLPNPVKFRCAIFRDGLIVGAARTKADAQQRIDRGDYDPEAAPRN